MVHHGIPCYEMQLGDVCLPPNHPDAINCDDSVVFDTFRRYSPITSVCDICTSYRLVCLTILVTDVVKYCITTNTVIHYNLLASYTIHYGIFFSKAEFFLNLTFTLQDKNKYCILIINSFLYLFHSIFTLYLHIIG